MRILVNAYFSKNLGDDLFLKILFERYPKVDWYLLTANAEYNDIFGEYDNVRILKGLSLNILGLRKVDVFHKVNDLLLKYYKYDGLVTIGGSVFMEGAGWKGALERKSILPRKFKKMNKKAFIIGANFGPFSDSSFISSHKEFFSLFEDICLRDQYSFSLFKELENVRIAPDVVLNLTTAPVTKEKSVGISLINLSKRDRLKRHAQKYNEKMVDLVEYYIKRGYKIRIFSFCEKEGDLIISNFIKEKINNKMVEVINYNGDIESFLSKFKTCEIIIGTRFHSIILAIVYNQSLLPIIYSNKTYNVLKDLNLVEGSYFIRDIEKLEVENIIFNRSEFQMTAIFSEAETQFKALDHFIENKSHS